MKENDFDVKIKSARLNVYNNDSGNSYTVIKHDDIWICDCKSYQFCVEPKTCKHIEDVQDRLDGMIPEYEEEE